MVKHLEKQDAQKLAEDCGVPLEQIRQAAEMLKYKHRIIVCWAMGITQHVNGVDTIKEITNLILLKGSIGKPGAAFARFAGIAMCK